MSKPQCALQLRIPSWLELCLSLSEFTSTSTGRFQECPWEDVLFRSWGSRQDRNSQPPRFTGSRLRAYIKFHRDENTVKPWYPNIRLRPGSTQVNPLSCKTMSHRFTLWVGCFTLLLQGTSRSRDPSQPVMHWVSLPQYLAELQCGTRVLLVKVLQSREAGNHEVPTAGIPELLSAYPLQHC